MVTTLSIITTRSALSLSKYVRLHICMSEFDRLHCWVYQHESRHPRSWQAVILTGVNEGFSWTTIPVINVGLWTQMHFLEPSPRPTLNGPWPWPWGAEWSRLQDPWEAKNQERGWWGTHWRRNIVSLKEPCETYGWIRSMHYWKELRIQITTACFWIPWCD